MQYENLHSGFSLLELLIASALSTLICAGLITVYLSVKTNNNQQQVLTDLQDTERFLQNFLNQRLRMAGFVGCVNSANPVDQNQAVIGYSSTGPLPAALQNQAIPGTDIVVIHACVSNSQISQNTELMSMAYYIGDTHRTNRQGQPVFGLFQKSLEKGERVELAAGVEQMQILYGLAVNPQGLLGYYPAAQVENWQAVRGVQIDLLLNSIDDTLPKPQTYYFHGQMRTADDLLLHKPVSTYVALRERFAP
jgi:type II secretory pathway pseudopilin PulG